jgi:hypothetical protein
MTFELGLIQSVPLVSFWYNHVVRALMGKVVTATGDLLDAAMQQAEKMTLRGQEIQRIGRDLAIENMDKLEEYRADLHENYLKGIRNWRESLDGSEVCVKEPGNMIDMK